MSVRSSRVAWYLIQALNASLFLCLGLWIFYQVNKITQVLLERAAKRQEPSKPNTPVKKTNTMGTGSSNTGNRDIHPDIFCSCIFGAFLTPLQFIIYSTILTIAMINVVLLCEIILNSLRVDHFLDYKEKINETSKIFDLIFRAVAFICFCCILLLLFIIHFERLSLTFKSTKYRLPKKSRTVEYSVIIFYTIGLILFNIFLGLNQTVSIIVGFLVSFMYLVINMYLIHGFYSRTISIANSLDRETPGLLSTTVRITICAIISLMTTVFNCFTYILTLIWCTNCNGWIFFRHLILVMDFTIGSFTLLCSFAEAEPFYLYVFGRLHKYFFNFLTQRKHYKTESMYRNTMAGLSAKKLASITVNSGNSSSDNSSEGGSPVSLDSIDFATKKTMNDRYNTDITADRSRGGSHGFGHARLDTATPISLDDPSAKHTSDITMTEIRTDDV